MFHAGIAYSSMILCRLWNYLSLQTNVSNTPVHCLDETAKVISITCHGITIAIWVIAIGEETWTFELLVSVVNTWGELCLTGVYYMWIGNAT